MNTKAQTTKQILSLSRAIAEARAFEEEVILISISSVEEIIDTLETANQVIEAIPHIHIFNACEHDHVC